jgi:riboflavin kinase/FMN adenylyltransferase
VEVIPLAFDQDLATLEAEAFIQDFLLDRVKGKRFLLGHDHRFGRGARGDAQSLRGHVADPQRDVILAEPLVLDGEVVSSSGIRAWLEAGKVDRAAMLLGRPYSYAGTVVSGDRRGRTLGFPTANLETGFALKAPVARGVYGGFVRVEGGDGKDFPAVANVGINPTFDGTVSKIEVHLLDFDGDLYGRWIEFRLLFHVRPEIRFPGLDALKTQIAADVETVRGRLAALPR